jgi:hypothetical protein
MEIKKSTDWSVQCTSLLAFVIRSVVGKGMLLTDA